ncbi:MAG TPA: hypothetical protein VGR49_07570 [Actinomycetota bacterium]|jgi:hypothetical protein|nr:hypothetical protein [Actinomycetota bacterium]
MGLSAVSNPLKTEKATFTAHHPKDVVAAAGGFSLGGLVSSIGSSLAAAPSSFLFGAGGLMSKPGIATLGKLVCKFNPTELSIKQSAKVEAKPNPDTTTGHPVPDYRGPQAQTLSMKLLFDEWEALAASVTPAVDMLLSWTLPVEKFLSSEAAQQPWIEFRWGKAIFGHFILTSANVTYTMFRKNGTPVRAEATIELQRVGGAPPPPTNPTSRGAPGWRTRLVTEGETLHSIAFQTYGHPKFWRGLADFNGIDDPLRVGVGARLLIPPRSDVDGLS